jgi:hypothetical protein
LVCKDGPVFDLSDVNWDKVVAPPTREALLKIHDR